MERRDDFGEPVFAEQIDDVLHHGLVRYGSERLGAA
jgi:hypothetical protein